MLKKIIIHILLITTTSCLFGQDLKKIKFINSFSFTPLGNVSVFVNGKLECLSNEKGECLLEDSISEIHCSYMNCYDTIVSIKECKNCVVALNIDFIVLNEVEIASNNNAKKQLKRLLKKSQKTAYKLDTTIYYEFKEINYIHNTGQFEIFSGILRLENKGYSKKINLIYVDSVSNYYNSIDKGTYNDKGRYECIRTSRIYEKFILHPITNRMIKYIAKNYDVRKGYSTEDTIHFNLSSKNEKITTMCNNISFVNGKIHSSEIATVQYFQPKKLNYCFKINYSSDRVILPEYIISNREYLISDGIVVNNIVELELIDKPDFGFKVNKLLLGVNCKDLVEKIEVLNPNIVIPKKKVKLEELYKCP